MSGSKLTAEQLQRIEENKRKALAKLAHKNKSSNPYQKQITQFQNTERIVQGTSFGQPQSSKSSMQETGSKVLLAPNTQIRDEAKTSPFCNGNSVSGAKTKVESKQENIPSNISAVPVSSNLPKSITTDADRIEQNRLKALALRAERLNKSPTKPPDNVINLPPKPLCNTISSEKIMCPPGHSDSNPLCFQNQNNMQGLMSFQKGTNVFANASAPGQSLSFKGTPVKGDCVLVARDRFTVKAGYSAPLVQLIKSMNTRLYDAVTKSWSMGLSEYNKFMSHVVNLKPAVVVEPLPKPLVTAFAAQIKGDNSSREIPIADLSRVEDSLVSSLMSFQRTGVNFGVYKNGRVLFGDDMGLGKTIQAICLSRYYKEEWPLLVVVPSSVRFDWSQQFQRWIPTLNPQTINVVVTGKDSCTSGLINILSYDLMARKAEELKKKMFQVIIMDECHLLKNYKTARCKAALPLLQAARRVILLSGTPALSRPSELYTQITAVCPYLFKFHDFGVRYCAGKQEKWGWDFTGFSNMEELQILLQEKIMIRRLKKEVLTELPDKIRQMILLDPSSIRVSKELKTASKVMTSANLKKKDEQGALLDFFHKSGAAKKKAIKMYVEDILEGERKILIFAHHGDILDAIEGTVRERIGNNYMRIDGKTNSEQRNFSCRKFQTNEDMRVAILSITAANAGLNLSSANLVVFAELFWNPGILVQAEDRAHRIGQQDSVLVQYLVATGTSDDHIWPMIQKKLDVLGKAGLTKDNFASAETTRLTDQRQQEITQFLDESFHIDTSFTKDDTMDDAKPSTSPRKGSQYVFAGG
ncbi:SWI/SNF-related matrix-associated actin-dependent regulator of chromatin subfamily A-like protein 1 isoform X2 [Mya arenaria]|uniref:SWI/SNF-related matrix-associated actin-dependent regulator of chromatin subfamily A-like protein 1 isoform X2 n=1 Tax=Mya arenaria TaxID=6604 RepID=UPI0022E5C408|nr:SWI/SNF-related matrix-associated actin-dependent regulator of chromatin subfamily A-like protein 1 isoform X2 [Mya arenaria]